MAHESNSSRLAWLVEELISLVREDARRKDNHIDDLRDDVRDLRDHIADARQRILEKLGEKAPVQVSTGLTAAQVNNTWEIIKVAWNWGKWAALPFLGGFMHHLYCLLEHAHRHLP